MIPQKHNQKQSLSSSCATSQLSRRMMCPPHRELKSGLHVNMEPQQNISRAQELPAAGFSGDGELSILCGISFNEIGGGHIGLNLHIGMPNDVHQ